MIDNEHTLTPSHPHILTSSHPHILTPSQVLEKVTYLNLSHNRLHSLEGIHAFVAVETINLVYNLLASCRDLDRLSQLRRLNTLSLAGEP